MCAGSAMKLFIVFCLLLVGAGRCIRQFLAYILLLENAFQR